MLKYGESTYPSSLLNVNKNNTETKKRIGWYFYLLETNNRKILIDTGFSDKKYINRFSIKQYKSPLNLLSELDIKKENITDIIITHSHFDHAGSVHLFPNAKIYIHEKEFTLLKNTDEYNQNLVFYISKFIKAEIVFNDSIDLIEGRFFLEFVGGHTDGSRIVKFNNSTNNYLFTGDECYLIQECIDGIGLPQKAAFDISKNQSFVRKLKKEQEVNKYIILSLHEPQLENQFKQVFEGVYKIE
jgi:glyoxylase-like metal-dependent hydrolase (beta-lactamase superfamily II)